MAGNTDDHRKALRQAQREQYLKDLRDGRIQRSVFFRSGKEYTRKPKHPKGNDQ